MKRNILHILWAAALLPLALVSCKQEIFSDETDCNDEQPLIITVTDRGYAPQTTDDMNNATTRAIEEDFRTEFTVGDKCGLYVVYGGQIAYDNICLTAITDTDGGLTWQVPEGITLRDGLLNKQFFLYYPYQEDDDMYEKVTVADAVNGDAAFFAPLISGWQPKADQSDYANYTASDLMTASGTIKTDADGNFLLSFSMTHRMAMAVIKMPKMVYKFSNTEPPVSDYTITIPADFSSVDKPFTMADGSYRYLVNPEVSGDNVILAGSYDNGNREFAITPSISESGNYKTYKVDGEYKKIEHNLLAGDFYMKDGTLLSKGTELTDAQKANCVGVVFCAVDATDTDPILKNDYPQCVHGLVLSLNEANGVTWQASYNKTSSIQDWAETQTFYQSGGFKDLNSNVQSYKLPGDIQGYNNTKILEAYDNAFANDYPVTVLDCFSTITDGFILPDGITSGWYLPSPKELVELAKMRNDVNISLESLQDNETLRIWYLSSGEIDYEKVWFVNLNDEGQVLRQGKNGDSYYVRLVFAF